MGSVKILCRTFKIRLKRTPQVHARKECALCGTTLPVGAQVSLCNECMKCADCCVGLESLRD